MGRQKADRAAGRASSCEPPARSMRRRSSTRSRPRRRPKAYRAGPIPRSVARRHPDRSQRAAHPRNHRADVCRGVRRVRPQTAAEFDRQAERAGRTIGAPLRCSGRRHDAQSRAGRRRSDPSLSQPPRSPAIALSRTCANSSTATSTRPPAARPRAGAQARSTPMSIPARRSEIVKAYLGYTPLQHLFDVEVPFPVNATGAWSTGTSSARPAGANRRRSSTSSCTTCLTPIPRR